MAPTSPQLVVVSSVQKVRPKDSPDKYSGNKSAKLLAARNEFESFQIVIWAGDSELQQVKVELPKQPLKRQGEAGETVPEIPVDNITIYREDYYTVTVPSSISVTPDQINAITGEPWPDILIPTVDPWFHQERNAFPINVPAKENRVAWVDVLVPKDTPPGTYQGSIAVTAIGFQEEVQIEITVFNADLPSTASLKNAFVLSNYDSLCLAKHGQSCFELNPPLDGFRKNEEEGWRLNALLARIALDNRITISYPHYQPLQSPDPNHPEATNYTYFEKYILPLLTGKEPATRLSGAKLTSIQVDLNALEVWKQAAEEHNFADRAFVYACDEPHNDPTERWPACRQNVVEAHKVWSWVPILVTTSIQEAVKATWSDEDGKKYPATEYINWLVPNVITMDGDRGHSPLGPEYEGNQRHKEITFELEPERPISTSYDDFCNRKSNQVWLYTSCASYGCGGPPEADTYEGWPGYAIDAPASEARAMGWLSFLYETDGELYYDVARSLSTARTNQYASGVNGDGTLFYPGDTQYIGGKEWIPLESIRLKLIRDGYEDYDYLKLLALKNQGKDARRITQELFPNMYSTDLKGQDQDVIQAARRKLAQLIDPDNVPDHP